MDLGPSHGAAQQRGVASKADQERELARVRETVQELVDQDLGRGGSRALVAQDVQGRQYAPSSMSTRAPGGQHPRNDAFCFLVCSLCDPSSAWWILCVSIR